MSSHTKLVTLILIVVAMMALASCSTPTTPQVSPTQPQAATQPPATQPPASQPTTGTQPTTATQPTAATQPTTSQVTQKNLTFGLAVHSDPATDVFWGVVARGAKDAAATYGLTLKSGGNPDPKQQAALIDNYVAAKVDGIIVSMANPDALKDSIQRAVAAGIPVITINSGESRSKEFGALVHIGQSERVAGQGAGNQFNTAGVKRVLCVIQEEANIGLEDRCNGVKDTFKGDVVRFSVASTGTRDVKGSSTAIQDKLTSDKTIDAVLTLQSTIAIAARDAIKAAGGSQKLATFDLSADVLKAVQNGEILFAIDQQQYLQGYMPIVLLYLYKTNLNILGGGQSILTGPAFVTKSNAAQIIDLTSKGTR